MFECRWLLECARCGRKVDEQSYLIDAQPAITVNDSRMTTTSVNSASKVAKLRHNDTLDDTRREPAESPALNSRNGENVEVTTTSNSVGSNIATTSNRVGSNIATTSTPCRNNADVLNDDAAMSTVRKIAPSNQHEYNTDDAKDTECKQRHIDVQKSNIMPPCRTPTVDKQHHAAKRMNTSALQDNQSDESPACNQQFKVISIYTLVEVGCVAQR